MGLHHGLWLTILGAIGVYKHPMGSADTGNPRGLHHSLWLTILGTIGVYKDPMGSADTCRNDHEGPASSILS